MTETLDDYKKEVEEGMTASLEWQQDLFFTATTRTGYDLDFDANIQMGCMPLEGVLMSLAGCMAIDVLAILKKMRCEIDAFRMDVEGERNRTPPQRIRGIKLTLHIKGKGISEDKVKKVLGIPEEVRIVELMPLGYPEGPPKPERSRKTMQEFCVHERWI